MLLPSGDFDENLTRIKSHYIVLNIEWDIYHLINSEVTRREKKMMNCSIKCFTICHQVVLFGKG